MMCCCFFFFFEIQALSELYTSMKIMQPKCARNKRSCNLRFCFPSHVKILPSPLLTAHEALRNHESVLYWCFFYTFSFMNQQPTVKILQPTLQEAMDSATIRTTKHSWNLLPVEPLITVRLLLKHMIMN